MIQLLKKMININTKNINVEDYDLVYQIITLHSAQQKNLLTELTSALNLQYPMDHRCMARIHDNSQCTRKYRDVPSKLCGSHINSIPHGRIDIISNNIIEKKHTNKNTKDKNITISADIDLSKYVKTTILSINGQDYLHDNNNILFDNNNDTTTILGRIIGENQYEWF